MAQHVEKLREIYKRMSIGEFILKTNIKELLDRRFKVLTPNLFDFYVQKYKEVAEKGLKMDLSDELVCTQDIEERIAETSTASEKYMDDANDKTADSTQKNALSTAINSNTTTKSILGNFIILLLFFSICWTNINFIFEFFL